MKKIILTSVILLTAITGAVAMSYDQAREKAAFLTDKMAHELDLSEEQYDAAYEINLDYLMSVNDVDDVYADNWQERNYELEQLLQDWQWQAFCAASYFYRPLYWGSGSWHFGVYARYPQRNFFYFDRPDSYFEYHGTPRPQNHSFTSRYNSGRSIAPRNFAMAHTPQEGRAGGMQRGSSGMSGVQRGTAMQRGGSGMQRGGSGMQRGGGMGNMRQSSTRSTVGSEGGFRPEMRTRSTNTFRGSGQRVNVSGGHNAGSGQHSNGGGNGFNDRHR